MGYGQVAAATGAGIVTTVVGHPLDTIKVHLQIHRNQNALQVAKDLFHQRALFRGIAPPLVNAVVMNACMFSVFSGIKAHFGDDHSFQASLLAGLVSGFATACISTPTDFIKIQAQLHGIQQHLRSIPLTMLFRGHLANLGREGIFTTVYLGLYDQARPKGFWDVAAVASVTGGLAWIVSYPFDTIKTIKQSSPSLSYNEIIQRSRGKLFRGCATSTGRAVMVTSLRMIVYEAILSRLSDK